MAEGTGAQPVPFWPPRVLNVALGQDTAGWGVRLKAAFERYSTWPYRSLATTRTYIGYPADLTDVGRLNELWSRADIIHVRNSLRAHMERQRRMPRALVLQHHGTAFRSSPVELDRQARVMGAVQIVSTVDLLGLAPDLTWVPVPYDLDALASLREHRPKRPKVIRIAHAPTDRRIKGTARIIAAVERIAERYLVEFDLIEGASWTDCLARKARADIFIDQLILGYGSNSVEAWAMGLPVIAGVTDPEVRSRMVELWGELPFAAADDETLDAVLERLVADADARAEWAQRGSQHAERWHAEARVVRQLEGLYTEALGRTGKAIGGLVSAGQTHPIFKRAAA